MTDPAPMDGVLALFRDTCAAQDKGDIEKALRWFGLVQGDSDEQFTATVGRALAANHLAATQLVANVRSTLLVQTVHSKASKEHVLVHSELACAAIQWPEPSPNTALVPFLVASAFSRYDTTPAPFFTSHGMATVVNALATSDSPDDALRVEYRSACVATVNAMLAWVRHASTRNAGTA